jgi:hypothetical protein
VYSTNASVQLNPTGNVMCSTKITVQLNPTGNVMCSTKMTVQLNPIDIAVYSTNISGRAQPYRFGRVKSANKLVQLDPICTVGIVLYSTNMLVQCHPVYL